MGVGWKDYCFCLVNPGCIRTATLSLPEGSSNLRLSLMDRYGITLMLVVIERLLVQTRSIIISLYISQEGARPTSSRTMGRCRIQWWCSRLYCDVSWLKKSPCVNSYLDGRHSFLHKSFEYNWIQLWPRIMHCMMLRRGWI